MSKQPALNRRTFMSGGAAATVATIAATSPAAAEQEKSMSRTSERADTEQARARRVEIARSFFELLHRKDIDGWARLWADDGRILVFYPPTGFGNVIDGKAQILGGFRDLFSKFDSFDPKITGVYPAADSDAVCVEYDVRATLAGGAEYTNRNIAIFRFENDLISVYHDYFDPRRFQMVVDAPVRR
jgi:ketosteroid isomerase-like protein